MKMSGLRLLIVVFAFPLIHLTHADQAPRVVILSLDGNAYWFMGEFLRRGNVKTLQRRFSTYHFSAPNRWYPASQADKKEVHIPVMVIIKPCRPRAKGFEIILLPAVTIGVFNMKAAHPNY